MLPLILFRMICSFFQNEQAFIQEHRRKGVAPKDWQDHIPDLVEAEWAIDAIKAEGARRLLAGQPIDFYSIRIPAPPDDWQPIVHDAADLMRRFEAVASFHADPEKFIRRHAERLVVRNPLRLDASHRSTSPGLRPVEANGTSLIFLIRRSNCLPMSRSDRGRWMVASSRPDGGGWRGRRKSIPP
ncbi:MAG: hypothetical protein Q8R02_24875 [Hyphomonadaceae bacterium]|nr:hypothetical protein [Hyphomonadaceae bacterium]